MTLDFVFGPPADDKGNTGILMFVCRLSKMVHLAPVRNKVTGKQTAQLFLDRVFRYHGLPEAIVSDRDPLFTGAFWDTLFQLLGTKLTMSTADHPQTDGQTERVNRVLEDKCLCGSTSVLVGPPVYD
ncbi:RNA-directed DNA polymerase [Phytophthora palmivora]|uniref:RNA-directed DNA polymerase n=1 Tax=Phytophthora palmivora TaxID=4796 RepID=A0A2P4YJH0_9STRA|nr:RNA-directed DNA polymerase [Phytophthora palmivora]